MAAVGSNQASWLWVVFSVLTAVVTLALYAVWLAFPITIITADIGRHITDGRVFFEQPELRNTLLHTNFYSVSNGSYSIVNHHWAAGVIFYIVQVALGWEGLHVFAMALCITALASFMFVAVKHSTCILSTTIATLLLPMIAYRLEVRPEFIGYALLGCIFVVLYGVRTLGWNQKYIYVLPVFIGLWVNIHASFPVGLALIGLFMCDAFLWKIPTRKAYLTALLLSTLATLVNPSGMVGALYPFSILHDPGYAVLENQSLLFAESIGIRHVAFTYLKICTGLVLLSYAVLLHQKKFKDYWVYAAMALLMVLMGWLSIRHITFAGFFCIPLFSICAYMITKKTSTKIIQTITLLIMTIAVILQGKHLSGRWIVLGLEPGANAAAEFIKEQGIQGPVFNNFDIGGYLTYYFFPDIKPYVYNRPESHPSDFWRDTYIPALQNRAKWNVLQAKQGFNVILLFHGDRTSWAQKFLVDRIKDPEWIPVFVDRSVMVMVRQNSMNAEVITKFGIPASQLLQ